MNIIRFTSTFKPEKKDYTKISIWNRYFRNKTLMLTILIPTAGALYFLYSDPHTPFWWVFILIALYPFYSLMGFYFKIQNHLKYRSPMDTAKTEYTFMNNGILADRHEIEKLDLFHWDDVDMLWELKGFLLLYKKERLVLVFNKADMGEGQCDAIREYITKHLPRRNSPTYKKSTLF